MDFIDELRNFSSHVLKIKDVVATEQATKTSLVMPFFKLLGYDIFNPKEFVPEFSADIGNMKSDKVDYAIVINDSPTILVECKKYGENLNNDKHLKQLFDYYATTPSAKLAILTDGITYQFYADIDAQNLMDTEPFLIFNILDIQEHLVPELKLFTKSSLSLDVNVVIETAKELKHTSKIRELLNSLKVEPPEHFVKYVMTQINAGKQTANAINTFRPIVKRCFNQFINDNIREAVNNTLKNQIEKEVITELEPVKILQEPVAQGDEGPLPLSYDEIEAFAIVKSILREICDANRIAHRNASQYVSILLDDNQLKRICRLWFKGKRKIHITIPDENRKPVKYDISSLNDIYNYADLLKESCNRHLSKGAFKEEDEEEILEA